MPTRTGSDIESAFSAGDATGITGIRCYRNSQRSGQRFELGLADVVGVASCQQTQVDAQTGVES
jgi:hypothetical protein